MAACVKSFLPLLLLVGMLGLLTVSSSAEDVNVSFIFEQRLDSEGEVLISGNDSSLIYPQAMTAAPGDIWVLNVTLIKGESCEYSLMWKPEGWFSPCICSPFKRTVLSLPEYYPLSMYAEIVTGYDCNKALCPRPGKSVEGIRVVV